MQGVLGMFTSGLGFRFWGSGFRVFSFGVGVYRLGFDGSSGKSEGATGKDSGHCPRIRAYIGVNAGVLQKKRILAAQTLIIIIIRTL